MIGRQFPFRQIRGIMGFKNQNLRSREEHRKSQLRWRREREAWDIGVALVESACCRWCEGINQLPSLEIMCWLKRWSNASRTRKTFPDLQCSIQARRNQGRSKCGVKELNLENARVMSLPIRNKFPFFVWISVVRVGIHFGWQVGRFYESRSLSKDSNCLVGGGRSDCRPIVVIGNRMDEVVVFVRYRDERNIGCIHHLMLFTVANVVRIHSGK